jgi:hypothetical protein
VVGEALFAGERVNQGRQLELDVAKGLAIVFMVLVHCLETLTPLEATASAYVIEFLGGPLSAPVFMFALGVGIVYSKKNTPSNMALRGLRTLVLAYLLNFLRDYLPLMFDYVRSGDPDLVREAGDLLFGIDILPFAGLVFLFFAGASKLNFKPLHYVLSAIAMAGANILLLNIVPQNKVLNVIAGSFWGTNEYSWFPFLTWIIYPLAGYLFGLLLIRCTDKKRLYRRALQISLPILGLFAIGALLRDGDLRSLGHLIMNAYYHHTAVANVFIIAVVLAWMSAMYFWSSHIPKLVTTALRRWSKNITTLYFVHWVILGWALVFLEPTLTLPWMFAFFVALLIVSDGISHSYLKMKAARIVRRRLPSVAK